jgi:hypothetical protein
MKRFLFIAALAMIGWLAHNANQWSAKLYADGAAAGGAIAEAQSVFEQREKERQRSVQAIAEAVKQREEQKRKDRATHNAVWAEIERLRQQDEARQ